MSIEGGGTFWARQTEDSNVFTNKPHVWFKIWFFLVSRSNHTDNKQFKRGECFMKYAWIEEKTKATKNEIDHFMRWAKGCRMLATEKATRGMVISILKYDYFQTLDNYKSDSKSDLKAKQKRNRSDTINKNDKYDKNDKNKKNNTPPTPPKGGNNILPECITPQTWKAFLSHRRAINAPISKEFYPLILEKFENLNEKGWPPDVVLEHLVSRGWRWFNPNWLKGDEIVSRQGMDNGNANIFEQDFFSTENSD